MLRFFLFLPLEFICQLLYTFYLPLHMLLNLQTSERPCRCSITHSTYLTYLVLLTVLVHTNQLYSQQVWCPGCGLKVCQTKRRRKLTTYSIQERSPKGPNQSHLRSQNASGRRRTSTPLLCFLSSTSHLIVTACPLSIPKTCSPCPCWRISCTRRTSMHDRKMSTSPSTQTSMRCWCFWV